MWIYSRTQLLRLNLNIIKKLIKIKTELKIIIFENLNTLLLDLVSNDTKVYQYTLHYTFILIRNTCLNGQRGHFDPISSNTSEDDGHDILWNACHELILICVVRRMPIHFYSVLPTHQSLRSVINSECTELWFNKDQKKLKAVS